MEPDNEKLSENVKAALDIILEHGVYIRQVIRGLTVNDSDAEDLFQDFFLRLVQRPIGPRVKNIRGFLRKLLVFDALDTQRRARRRAARVEKYCRYFKKSVNNGGPGDAIVEEEQLDALLGAFDQYEARQRSLAVRLRFREARSNAEIAAIMGISEDSVSRYISTALAKMRKIMEDVRKKEGSDNDAERK
ncbi:MAG TPA: sigma-70 family RNA polymerase sigma factor [Phycisphaerales bacterium]|mgnify:CR=1 FL=1|nr:sigma-70 family RNA polymerase sigma factor [Phycisphaerales bacterium]